jgi:hypothetical protein
LGCFGTLGRVLSKGRKAGSGGALFVGRVAIAERVETAFKRLFCALWVRIGKEGCEGMERGATGGVKTRKGALPVWEGALIRRCAWLCLAWLSRPPNRNLTPALLAPGSVWQTPGLL